MTGVAERTHDSAVSPPVDHPPGLYVHIPFCATRCPYCDFNVITGAGDDLRDRYLAALRADLDRLAASGPPAVAGPRAQPGSSWPTLGSVFVGGGTPTQVPAGDLAALLRRIRERLPVAADAEVTVEANPEDVTPELVTELVDAGLTRLSLGAQSFVSDVLAFLGRRHGPEATLQAVESARAGGVGRLSLDLIYGAPCETDGDWLTTLDTAIASGAGHISAYALTVEVNTPYASDIRRGQRRPPDDDVQAERMAAAADRLATGGFRRYELSNWALPGKESRHNLAYWRGGNWLALGAGAHGHWAAPTPDGGLASRRWWLTRSTSRYTDAALSGEATTAGEELPDDADRRTEQLMMGLRLAEGVARATVEPVDEVEAGKLAAAGLLHDDGHRLALTPAGQPLAEDLIVRLLPD